LSSREIWVFELGDNVWGITWSPSLRVGSRVPT
jgi:hypothetical protein